MDNFDADNFQTKLSNELRISKETITVEATAGSVIVSVTINVAPHTSKSAINALITHVNELSALAPGEFMGEYVESITVSYATVFVLDHPTPPQAAQKYTSPF